MSELLLYVWPLASAATKILVLVLGVVLMRSQAFVAGVLLMLGGFMGVFSSGYWVAIRLFNFSSPSPFADEFVFYLLQGASGLSYLATLGGLVILVLLFRAQTRRARELEQLVTAMQSQVP